MRRHSGSIVHFWLEKVTDYRFVARSAWQALKGGLATLTNLQSLKINGICFEGEASLRRHSFVTKPLQHLELCNCEGLSTGLVQEIAVVLPRLSS
jgi:hypothetical protein